jgi:hypothetical protein
MEAGKIPEDTDPAETPCAPQVQDNAVSFAGAGEMSVGVEQRDLAQSRMIALSPEATICFTTVEVLRGICRYIPNPTTIGTKSGGHNRLSDTDRKARAQALSEAGPLKKKLYAQAKAEGRFRPKTWANEQAAEFIQRRIQELGGRKVGLETILRWTI